MLDPFAIVFYLQDEIAVLPADFDYRFSCLRMESDICERFLADAEDRSRSVASQRDFLTRQGDFTPDPGAPLELLRLPLQRGKETQLIQDSGPQFRRDKFAPAPVSAEFLETSVWRFALLLGSTLE